MLDHQHPGENGEQAQGSLHLKGHEGEVVQHEEKDCLIIRLEFLAKTSFTNCNIAVQDDQGKTESLVSMTAPTTGNNSPKPDATKYDTKSRLRMGRLAFAGTS